MAGLDYWSSHSCKFANSTHNAYNIFVKAQYLEHVEPSKLSGLPVLLVGNVVR